MKADLVFYMRNNGAIELLAFKLSRFVATSEKTNSDTPNPFGEIGIIPAILDNIDEIDITFKE